jgi:DNA-binding beta-propeller fold protein YncE
VFLCIVLFYSICSAQDIIERREVLDDGTILVKLETRDGVYKWYYWLSGDIESDFYFSGWEDSSVVTFGDDELEATVWMPDELGGCLPRAGCYNSIENKYYFYGGRSVVVIDGATNTLIKRITVSTVGHSHDYRIGRCFPVENRLAFNPIDNKLYCATDELTLVIIDCSADEIIDEYANYSIYNSYGYWTSVYYNEENNRAYYGVTTWYGLSSISVFDGSTNSLIDLDWFWDTAFYSLTGNPSGSRLYLGKGDPSGSYFLSILDGTDLSVIEEIPMENPIGDMVYTENSNKLYALPLAEPKVIVINGLTDELERIIDINDSNSELLRISCDYINNKIYCTGTFSKVHVIDGEQDEYITTFQVNGAFSLVYNPYEGATFCGGRDVICKIDGENDQIIDSTSIYGSTSHGLVYNFQNHNVISYYQYAGLTCIVDRNCNLLKSNQIGGGIVFGCYNSQNNKIYYCQSVNSQDPYEKSFISIIDGETNQVIKKIDTVSHLRYPVYNESVNKVYVLRDHEKEILVLDGNSDTIIDTISIDRYGVYCLFSGPTNKIYCGSCSWIDVIDAETDEIITSLNVDGHVRAFTYNSEDNKLYAAQYSYTDKKILVLDPDNDVILKEIWIGEAPTSLPIFSMAYNSANNKVYCADNTDCLVTIIDCYEDEVTAVINTPYLPMNIAYSVLSNKLYLTCLYKTCVIDGNTDEIIKEFDIKYAGSLIIVSIFNN